MLETKVCIVGGGPAGLTASLFLSKHKIHHIIVERLGQPVEKVCGECYDGRLISTFNKLDTSVIDEMMAKGVIHQLKACEIVGTNGKTFYYNLTKAKGALRVSAYRPNFDAYLLQLAIKSEYAHFVRGINITHSKQSPNTIHLFKNNETNTYVKAQIAIFTTGNASPISNQIQQKNLVKSHFLLAARAYFKNLNINPSNQFYRIYFTNKPAPAYLYMVQLPNNLYTVEIIMLKSNAVKSNHSPEELLKYVIANDKRLIDVFKNATVESKFKGTSLPKTATGKFALSASNILLAGSCGNGVNPITGWGVGHAVFQGMCAAEQCVKSLNENNFSEQFLKQYDLRVNSSLKSDWSISRKVDFIITYLHKPLNTFFSVVAANTFLSKTAEKVFAGKKNW